MKRTTTTESTADSVASEDAESAKKQAAAAARAARLFSMSFASIYPLYLQKISKKGRTQDELDFVLTWLTGYQREQLQQVIEQRLDLRSFFAQAPALNPHRNFITGVICGVRIEEISDPLMQQIRQMDKLVDELARGKQIASILRIPNDAPTRVPM